MYDERLKQLPGAWRGKRVVILGDMILDEYVYGRTNRVSREAPVVIVRYDASGYFPGGAANTAQNIVSLGGRAVPVGLIGRDDEGQRLEELMKERGVGTGALISVAELQTTAKIRIMAGDYHAQRQQIVRIDKEQAVPLSARLEERVLRTFERALERADAAVLSDYHQGLFTKRLVKESVARCRRKRIPVIADSRFRLASFRAVTAATPNEVEAAAAAGIELGSDLERIGRRLLKRIDAAALLVTRGRYGMALFEPRKRTRSVGVVGSTEATDVTGAGDTVVAAVALTLAAGGGFEEAMRLANIAAAVVVMKRGTATATVPEILELIGKLEREQQE
jgi:rfaE bifunctional protein kinase chain/domain